MTKKPVRNLFRDRLADYYLTNRAVTKEADERYQKEKEAGTNRTWSVREKSMVAITAIALVLLVLKYIF